ncbi:hypothetical protein M514_05901 [Trichuris suis]|uniref:Uncharacterized protein n=1 Tax=Trichuris suis TaxID=68888 RepID=A0A085MU11_9BILA|nr:hypothetical protein M514_05901 [Trichuris suis]
MLPSVRAVRSGPIPNQIGREHPTCFVKLTNISKHSTFIHLLSKIRYLNEPYCSPESLTAKQEAFKDFTIYICIYKLVRAVKGRPCSFGQTGETKAKGYNEHPSEIWDIHLMIVRLVWRSSGGQDGMP